MNAPWGVTIASANFGAASNKMLVGMFGSGQIIVFDPVTLQLIGPLATPAGGGILIPELRALAFGNGGTAGPATTLYFTAGISDGTHGLFGRINLR
jgi:uncharacterized protein (TIGR03118 family)